MLGERKQLSTLQYWWELYYNLFRRDALIALIFINENPTAIQSWLPQSLFYIMEQQEHEPFFWQSTKKIQTKRNGNLGQHCRSIKFFFLLDVR